MEYEIITTHDRLEQVCAQARQSKSVMLDTEFVRVRTYHAQLGLIQLYDGQSVSLIDPQAIDNMAPFVSLLTDNRVLKVLHACGEDLEVLNHVFGCMPTPFVDTQILAAFCGHGLSIGFATLVDECLDIQLDKSESRADWTARPLSEKQLTYAAADVFYLKPVYEHFQEKAVSLSWWQAALEESQLQANKRGRMYDSQQAYLDVKGAGTLQPKQLAILKRLATWRYQEALKRDLALNFVLKEADMLQIVRLGLVSPQRMREAGVDPRTVNRHGARMSQLVKEAYAQPESEYPPLIEPISDYRGYKQLFKSLKSIVKTVSEQQHLAPELLASRKQLNELICWIWQDDEQGDRFPEVISGWRKDVLGQQLYDSVKAF